MAILDTITKGILQQIDPKGFLQQGAFNLRYNGSSLCHGDSEHVKIVRKKDKPGIDVYIDAGARGEQVHIPVVLSASGMVDIVYNDFYVADGAEVTIVSGCGIHNSGCDEARHDGIHAFHIGKNCIVGAGSVLKGAYPAGSMIVQKRQTTVTVYPTGTEK